MNVSHKSNTEQWALQMHSSQACTKMNKHNTKTGNTGTAIVV